MVAAPSEIRLATEIAAQFKHVPTEEGAAAIAGHVRRFWDPRMRREIVAHLASGGADLTPVARAAVERLK